MATTLIISGITLAGIMLSVIVKPYIMIKNLKIGLYWVIALLGAITLVLFGRISLSEISSALLSNSAVNPLKILVLFICMTILSVFLDELGFFSYLASLVAIKCHGGQKRLFTVLFITISVLTVFTSNDIVILTFTPFICHLCKNAKINPIPYLFMEFVAANTLSMTLIIGNPTNIYLATFFGIDFLTYLKVMLLPSLMGATVAYIVLLILFHKPLSEPLSMQAHLLKITDKPMLIMAVSHLVLATVFVAIATYIKIEAYILCLIFAISLLFCSEITSLFEHHKNTVIASTLKRAPYELIPFVLSMFIIVMALTKDGVTDAIYNLLSGGADVFSYGFSSALFANIINNIPMSVLFGAVINSGGGTVAMAYATVIGSNIGAYITPIGALAGIMWFSILRENGVQLKFGKFILYGFIVALFTLSVSLLGLYIVI